MITSEDRFITTNRITTIITDMHTLTITIQDIEAPDTTVPLTLMNLLKKKEIELTGAAM